VQSYLIALILSIIMIGVAPAFADDSGYEGKHYEDEDSYPIVIVPRGDPAIQPPPSEAITECLNFTYTIINFLKSAPIAQQEELIRMLFEEFWGDHMKDVCFEYKKGANPDDVFGLIQMSNGGVCGKGEGCGGGDGPNTWCIATNITGSFGDSQFHIQNILAHEIGHCLGLPHFGGINAFDCMMNPTLQPFLTHCNAELNRLKIIWDGAVCLTPLCMEEGEAVTNGVMVSLIPSKTPIIEGDILTLTYTIKNIGNTQITSSVWVNDFTDRKLLYFKGSGLLLPSETSSLGFTWNTTDASIGEHNILAWFVDSRGEIDKTDNRLRVIFEIFGTGPPPPPFCEPDKCKDNNECTIDTCNEITNTCSNDPDIGKACGIAGTCNSNAFCVEPPTPPPPPFCQPDVCNDNNECTIDTCDEASKTCSIVPDVGKDCGIAGVCDVNAICVEPPPPPPCDAECIQDQRITTLEGFHTASQAALEEPVVSNLFIIVVIVIFSVTITIIVIIRTKK